MQNPRWVRKAIVAGVSATTALTGLSAFAGTAHAAANPTVDRQGGQDRFGTSALIAESQYPNGVPGGNVILATGYNYPDALAGSFLAGNLGSPVLLVPTSTSDPYYSETVAALSKLLPGSTKKVTILGGSAAVGDDVQSDLTSKGYTVSRIAGNTRYDTMQAIDSQPGTTVGNGQSGNKTCIVANGENFPDALAGGPLSFAKHFPIVLTNGTQQTLGSQASATIAADGCKNFIVLGGSAAVSQGIVTQLGTMGTVDKVVAGQDRSDTAAQLATYEITTYGFSNASNVILASGQTFPDALSSGPWGGNLTAAILLTELDGSLGQYSTAAFNKYGWTTIHIAGGTAAVSTSAQQQAVSADQGQTTVNNQTYTVTPAPSATPQTATVSTTSAPAQGVKSYSVSGLPTTAGTTANVALFPCTGSNAPVTNSSGTTTFTSTGGTNTAGNANGEGATTSNPGGNLNNGANPGVAAGTPAAGTSTAYIASVNGVPTAANGGGAMPTVVYGVSPNNGTVTFVLNSYSPDCAIPVVYTAPSTAGSTPPLAVSNTGQPASGYAIGEGQATVWSASSAPAGSYSNYEVISVNPTAGTFQAMPAAGGTAYTFTYNQSGSTYNYSETPGSSGVAGSTSALPLSQSSFSTYLSGIVGPTPATSTAPATVGAVGDLLNISYGGSSNPSTFTFDGVATNPGGGGATAGPGGSPAEGDVPAAPTAVTATYQAAVTTGSAPAQHPAGVLVTWTAPANPDVFAYQLQVATVNSSGVTGAFSPAGALYSYSSAAGYSAGSGTANGGYDNGQIVGTQSGSGVVSKAPATQAFDPNQSGGSNVVYRVIAYADGNNGNLCAAVPNCLSTYGNAGSSSPSSANSTPVTVTATAVPTVTGPLSQSTTSTIKGANLASGDSFAVNFNTPVTVASTWSLQIDDTLGNEGLVSNNNATATVANGGYTVIVTLTGAPVIVSGTTAPAVANVPWEMLTASGFTGTGTGTPAWNVEASGATGGSVTEGTSAVTVTREITPNATANNNGGLPAAPAVTIAGSGATSGTPNTVTATCKKATDYLNFYSSAGTLLGSKQCTGTVSASYTAPTGVTFASGTTYIVGESPLAAPVYTNGGAPGQESQTQVVLAS